MWKVQAVRELWHLDFSYAAASTNIRVNELSSEPSPGCVKSVPIVEIMRRHVVDWTLAGWLLSESPGGSWYENFFHRNLRQLVEEEAQPFVIFQIPLFITMRKFFSLSTEFFGEKEETLFCYQRASFFIVMKWLFILSSDFSLSTVEFVVVSGVEAWRVRW